jgi:hypothetical protein
MTEVAKWADGDYRNRPALEHARGACDCALAEGKYSHVILYDKKGGKFGGYYYGYLGIPFGTLDVDAFVKEHGTTFHTWTGETARKVMVIDLSEDVDQQLEGFEEALWRRVLHIF